MDFFEYQDEARRKTGRLVLMFLLGVAVTIILVNALGFAVYAAFIMFMGVDADPSLSGWLGSHYSWQLSVAVMLIVAAGSLAAYWQLREGGSVVARWAGAQAVDYDTRDPQVRQFVNVAEEMAIASGTPVPSLYIMHREESINAFVAGYQADQAILVVSRGALDALDREELQGVVAHEFSHILNGDMRLNVRLMAVLAGLVQIGQLGQWMVATAGVRSHSRRDRDANLAIPVIGLGLIAIGYVGVLTGRMIKAAVSRQREYLADASAVQFTRYPDGIAGALFKIREHSEGALLRHRHAEDMSHLCFGEAVSLSARLATHPPLDDRIRRINPTYLTRARHRKRQSETAEEAVSRSQPDAFSSALGGAAVMGLAGQVKSEHVDYARSLYRHIPEQVRTLVHQSAGARAFCYSQIMKASPGHEQTILNQLKQEDREALPALKRLWPFTKVLDDQLRLPILDMAVPVLKRLGERDRVVLLDRIDRLIAVDQRTDLREWVLSAQLRHHLRAEQADRVGRVGRVRSITQCEDAIMVVLSTLVYINREPDRAKAVFARVVEPFDFKDKSLRSREVAHFDTVTKALAQFDRLPFFWRRSILQACVDMVQSDEVVHQEEYELVRTLADSMGCPMPPLAEYAAQPRAT